jgi:opacity protein-like surface antigen
MMMREVNRARERNMRRILVAAALTIGVVQAGYAADLPVLRGGFVDDYAEPGVVDWQGVYIGGQAGWGRSDMNFTGTTRPVIASLLANTEIENEMGVSQWPLMGKESARGNGYGAFIGYNTQWDDVVIGVEASYMHGKFGGASADSMRRRFATTSGTHDVTATSIAAIEINDIGTLRARAGYAVGAFLPYIFGGVALGQADIVRSVGISGTLDEGAGPVPFEPLSKVEINKAHLLYGYTAGLGVDVALYAGLFLRAEWEYIRFTSAIDTNINTVRAGLGYKF